MFTCKGTNFAAVLFGICKQIPCFSSKLLRLAEDPFHRHLHPALKQCRSQVKPPRPSECLPEALAAFSACLRSRSSVGSCAKGGPIQSQSYS